MVWVLMFAFVGVWAAVAPQAALSLGERLRFSFEAITIFCLGVAATSGLRRRVLLIEGCDLPLRKIDGAAARLGFDLVRSGHEVFPAIPFLLFLAALEVVEPSEVFVAIAAIALATLLASVITSDRLAVTLGIAAAILFLTWRRHSFDMALCGLVALHIIAKVSLGWDAIELARLRKANLCNESMAPGDPIEILQRYQALIWRTYKAPIFGLAAINVAVLIWVVEMTFSATLEQKFCIAVALIGGIALLFVDASAFAWCGLLRGVTAQNPHRAFASLFGTIVGIPWAVAWIFSALHSGEALTFNEAAGYFVMWSLLGGTISWISRANAKTRLANDLRALLSEA